MRIFDAASTRPYPSSQPWEGPKSGWKIGITWFRKRSFKMTATKLRYSLTKLSFWLSLWRDISIYWHGGKEL